ncbi:hypothetical protein SBRY_70136 [Actinacidiphila bryophytorum]|uniref:Protein kinase domain-containing protein n=1 Tax=Actinacidiphila bryophytorum TaxID=1436133 RepID=A0A9W4H6Z6_9ACTN|nr:hypothetical protein SBRY_70136 [Actinacidiphila bryophytorum]
MGGAVRWAYPDKKVPYRVTARADQRVRRVGVCPIGRRPVTGAAEHRGPPRGAGRGFREAAGPGGRAVVRFAHRELGGRRPAVDRRVPAVRAARCGWHGAGVPGRTPAGRALAVKTVRPQFALDPGFGARFAREIRNADRARSPWTVAVVDFSPPGAAPQWLATEYVPAPSLTRWARALPRTSGLPRTAPAVRPTARAAVRPTCRRPHPCPRPGRSARTPLTAARRRGVPGGAAPVWPSGWPGSRWSAYWWRC